MAVIKDLLDSLDVTIGYNEKRYTELYDLLHGYSCTAAELHQRLSNWPANGVLNVINMLEKVGLVRHHESRGVNGPMIVYEVIRAVELDRIRVEHALRIVKAKLALHDMSMLYLSNYLVDL